MRIGNIVKDKTTGDVGIIIVAWIDDFDGTSVVVEFLEKGYEMVYWSSGVTRLTSSLEIMG
jgi:hypothetical protein